MLKRLLEVNAMIQDVLIEILPTVLMFGLLVILAIGGVIALYGGCNK